MIGTQQRKTSGLPRVGTARSDLPSLGPKVAKLADMMGVHLMPWQRHVLDVSMEVTPEGRWRYSRVVVHVQRRAGKSTLTFLRQAYLAYTRPRQAIWFGAQSRKEGLDIWRQQLRDTVLPYAGKLHCRERQSVGTERVTYANGSEIALFTPSDSALVGLATDDVTLDEARLHTMARGLALEAGIRPTQATRDGQMWIVSSAGTFGQSDWLWGWLEKGRKAVEAPDAPIAYFDYSVPEDSDPTDLDLCIEHHPAAGHVVSREFLAAEHDDMDAYDFAREYAGSWTKATEQIIPGHDWAAGADTRRPMPEIGQLTLGFATSPTRSTSSIGAAWRTPDGRLYVAVLDHRPGVDWLIPRVHELREKWKPKGIVFNAVGPAVSVADKLKRDRVKLRGASTPEFVVACGQFYEHVLARDIFHHAQPALDDAVAGVGKRTLGERWVWGYKASEASISPLEAVTLAAWGFDHRPARRTPVVVSG